LLPFAITSFGAIIIPAESIPAWAKNILLFVIGLYWFVGLFFK